MTNTINNLVKQYILWPELHNDFQKNVFFANTTMLEFKEATEHSIHDIKQIEAQIALFYITNEKLSNSRKQTQDVLGISELNDYENYQVILNELSKNILSYIIICSLVESRHCYTFMNLNDKFLEFLDNLELPEDVDRSYMAPYGGITKNLNAIKLHFAGEDFIASLFDPYASYFHTELEFNKFKEFFILMNTEMRSLFKGSRRTGYHNVANEFLTILSDYTLQDISSYLQVVFTVNDFESGYGGKPWSDIITHGASFFTGKINAEMFVDQAFSLEHNGGNMFNKDFIFRNLHPLNMQFFFDTANNRQSDCFISVSALLLNSQHLTSIASLFSIENLYNFLDIEIKNIEYSIKNIDSIGQSLISKEDLPLYNHPHLTSQILKIYEITQNMVNLWKPIKEELLILSPHFAQALKDQPYIDVKQLFHEFASRNTTANNMHDLLTATEETHGFFDLWNYLQRSAMHKTYDNPIEKDFTFNIYDVQNLPQLAFDKNIIGGKAWSLVNMHNLGLPVPKAKVFTTDCCLSYYQHRNEFDQALKTSLLQFDTYLQHDSNPILCSIRSGAAISMPGMMDTILNVGIDDSNYDYFCNTLGKQVTDKCINKFMELFSSARLGKKIHFENNVDISYNIQTFTAALITHNLNNSTNLHNPTDIIEFNLATLFPLNKEMQIKESLIAVFNSWHSERARSYRTEKKISHDLGTAAIVQQMVFGNLNDKSCTGVVFSRDCLTGENKLVGEFLPKAQGEDVVSGSVTPFPIEQFKQFDLKSYNQLELIAKKLEQQTGQIQDIEFTVEDGKLYILQHRQAVCSPIANIKLLEDDTINKQVLLAQITPNMLQPSFNVTTNEVPCAIGLSANSGVMQGMIIKSEKDILTYQTKFEEQKLLNPNFGWIFYADLTSPEHMPLMNKTQAFITEQGGFTSHAAIIARSLNKPCIVGLGGDKAERFTLGDIITIDATNGKIWKGTKKLSNNNQLAKAATNALIQSNNINIDDINIKDFYEHIQQINKNNRSWVFSLPHAIHIQQKPVKKAKFLNIGQKIAMILAAEQTQQIQSKKTLDIH